VIDLLISAVLVAPTLLAATMYIAKRLATFDLELRTLREEARLRHLRASNRMRSFAQAQLSTFDHDRANTHQRAPAVRIKVNQEIDCSSALIDPSVRARAEHILKSLADITAKDLAEHELFANSGTLPREAHDEFATNRSGIARTVALTRDRWRRRQLDRLLCARANQQTQAVIAEVPLWALALLGGEEAKRYAQEWAAHLRQRIDEGELRAARVDRRRLARRAIVMAVTRRVHGAHAHRRTPHS
jgi:hypothetical protein